MKSKRRWFAGLALILPLVILLVVFASMQLALAEEDASSAHKFYGGLQDMSGSLIGASEISADDADGEGRVTVGIPGNPLTSEGITIGQYGGPDRHDYHLYVQGEGAEYGMPLAFFITVDGQPFRAEVQECTEPNVPAPGWENTWVDDYPWLPTTGSFEATCLNLRADVVVGPKYDLTVQADSYYSVTVTAGGKDTIILAGETKVITQITSAELEVFPGDDVCYGWDGWSVDGGALVTETVLPLPSLTADTTVVANDTQFEYGLTINKVNIPDGVGGMLLPYEDETRLQFCGETITVTAQPEPLWPFAGWTGDLVTTDLVATIEMTGARVITGTFFFQEEDFTLVVTATEEFSIEVTYDGITGTVGLNMSDQFTVTSGMTVSLEAVGDCANLDGWTMTVGGVPDDRGPVNPLTFNMSGDTDVQLVSHGPPFTMFLFTDGRGTGTVEGDGAYDETCDDIAVITATKGANSYFAGWTGDAGATMDNPDQVTMDSDKRITATFNLVTYTMDISPSVPPGAGDIDIGEEWPEPEGEYQYGETITVTAVPSGCYEFVGWGGDLEGEPNLAVITVTADMNFWAIFGDAVFTLDVIVDPVDSGTVTLDPPGGVYTACPVVTLTAGVDFVGWSGALSGSTNPTTLLMDSDKVVTATFEVITGTVPILVGQVGLGNFVSFDGVTLTVKFDGAEATADVDANGLFTVTTGDIVLAPGTYTVCVKEMRALAVCVADVVITIPNVDPPTGFGTIVSGDADNDNDVDFDDFMLLATAYESAEYLFELDFNNDGGVPGPDFDDFMVVATNYDQSGDSGW